MIRVDRLVSKVDDWETDDKKTEKTILGGISLDIPPGQFLAVVGPNGSGKSTLARHLDALIPPSEGNIYIDGMSVRKKEDVKVLRQMIGMVFQNPDNQIIGNTVEEDAAFGPEVCGMDPLEIDLRVTAALKKTGMYEQRTEAVMKLSGGQKQRTAVAGVLAGNPSTVILDEPTAMLDTRSRRELMEVLHRLNRKDCFRQWKR